jgi:hypothetical protein
VPASDRATSRACSWMSRGILRAGSFGQALRFERANIAVELAGTIQLLDETTDSVQLHDYNFEATLDFFSYA